MQHDSVDHVAHNQFSTDDLFHEGQIVVKHVVPVTKFDWTKLDRGEKSKLEYLIRVKHTVDVLNTKFKDFEVQSAWNHGLSVHREVSWVDVQRYCFPQLIVIMISDGNKEKEFFKFPGYALIPRLEEAVDLSGIADPSDDHGRANRETEMSLDHLRSVIQSIDGSKGENAMKHLNILHRMLRATA